MNADRWAALKSLFLEALEQPAQNRDEWLRTAVPDPEMLREVKALLDAHDTAGSFLEVPATVPMPDQVGPYEIERELGRGGMGVVYLARDTRLNRLVALKSVPPLAAADAGLRDRLRREARAAAALTHPGIATVYALEEFDGELFLVSEYVGDRTLRDVMTGRPLPLGRAANVAAQIARALAAAHAAGVIHRDLKPENIVFSSGSDAADTGIGDTVKIVDFGIAHLIGSDFTLTQGRIAATPAYAAPEQLAGLPADARTDLYALGIVFGEMLLGAHPLAIGRDALPEAVREVLARCLSVDPYSRYQSAHEFLSDLERASKGHAPGQAYGWWVFHQAAAVTVYALTLIPIWTARQLIGGALGRVAFLVALAAVVVSSALRLHRWFASRWYGDEFRRVRARSRVPLLAADSVFSVVTVAAGLAVSNVNDAVAVLLVSLGVGIAVSFLMIEPATTLSAFHDRSASSRPRL